MALTLLAVPLSAQSEVALREYFEGRTVSPKLAMPGTENGVAIKVGEPVTPSEALTPMAVMSALAQYVDFGRRPAPETNASAPQRRPGLVRKGMLLQEADAIFGAPLSSSERKA